jgi:hypothetical protein
MVVISGDFVCVGWRGEFLGVGEGVFIACSTMFRFCLRIDPNVCLYRIEVYGLLDNRLKQTESMSAKDKHENENKLETA